MRNMFPPLARQSQLVRQVRLTQWLRPASPPSHTARRSISFSLSRFQEDNERNSPAPSNDKFIAHTTQPKTSTNSQRDDESQGNVRQVSRLAAFKNRQKPSDETSRDSARQILGYPADKPIRTRFAPSPTGFLHLGSLRTALFNNLVAKASKGGQFVLRIEDTDQTRLVKDAEERLLKDLKWAGVSWDEGPDIGGPYGPYTQSERLGIYNEHVQTLLDNGSAYRCFCTAEQLDHQKQALHEAGHRVMYPGTCRHIPSPESQRRAAAGEPHVIRLNSSLFGSPSFKDAIFGPFKKKDLEPDFVLVKTDGYPTYHFANVVDDHLMKITHVIRGEEWLISTPKHIALYQAFGWEPPTFAHLGLLINDNGSKLSKRDQSVDLSTYQNQNVFPMAMQSWLATLGSSLQQGSGTPRTVDNLANSLTFKFTRGGIKLNPKKLATFNRNYQKLLFETSDLTEHETTLIRDNAVLPLIREVEAITDDTSSPLIATSGSNPTWPHPLILVPGMLATQFEIEAYIHNIVSQKNLGFQPPAELARQRPYFFWRPPPDHFRKAFSEVNVDRDVLDAIHKAVHDTEDVDAALDGLTETYPSGDVLHLPIRLVTLASSSKDGPGSRIIFRVLGLQELRVRTSIARDVLNEEAKDSQK